MTMMSQIIWSNLHSYMKHLEVPKISYITHLKIVKIYIHSTADEFVMVISPEILYANN
jgi:hypothetical protein